MRVFTDKLYRGSSLVATRGSFIGIGDYIEWELGRLCEDKKGKR